MKLVASTLIFLAIIMFAIFFFSVVFKISLQQSLPAYITAKRKLIGSSLLSFFKTDVRDFGLDISVILQVKFQLHCNSPRCCQVLSVCS